MARAIDASELMIEIQAGSWDNEQDKERAEDLVLGMPTITPLNEPLRCTGCMYIDEDFVPYEHCIRAAGYADYYRRPPEGEEEN